jgi:outer membrane receptor protein involved in Fe transport
MEFPSESVFVARTGRFGDESEQGRRIEAYSRPFILINGKCKHYHANITNRTMNESIRQFAELLTEENIKLVTVHKDKNAIAIYGSRAIGGVIILSTKNRKACKEFERINLE